MINYRFSRRSLLLAGLSTLATGLIDNAAAVGETGDLGPYSKFASTGPWTVSDRTDSWVDTARSRTVPVCLHIPALGSEAPKGTILFSHGLGGSLESGTVWSRHWASWGFLAINVQHPGSDDSIWKGQLGSAATLFKNMRSAATPQQAIARFYDIHFVIDQLERQCKTDDQLKSMNISKIGMSGHSFGANTTLGIAGASFPLATGFSSAARDSRVIAAIAMSPDADGDQSSWSQEYGSITIPFLSLTGTNDGDVIGNGATPERRQKPFEYMHPGDKYLAVMPGVNHMFYNNPEGIASGFFAVIGTGGVNEPLVKSLTVAFWNAFLQGDAGSLKLVNDVDALSNLVNPGIYRSR